MKTELLAPAKNIETGKCAIDAGADAVYIGGTAFGARSKATNSIDELKELVEYAHKFYAKIYVTVNTILKDNELDDAKNLIKDLYDIGVDALIVQDMAIVDMAINKEIPPIPLHVSTQCHNKDIEKIKFFTKLGIPRVVLARELSLEKIKEIIKENPDMEIETFIHGALCVSYSGQCYLSQSIGGRSANRGECAQPCRKKYSLIDESGKTLVKDKHLLSLKDFNTSDYIKNLVDIGVKSFKIEGRMKDKNYVKNVVGYYRALLDNYSDKSSSGKVYLNFKPDLYKTFNRGYTNYFLKGRERCFNFDSPKFIGEYIGEVKKIDKNNFTLDLRNGITLSAQDGLTFGLTGEKGCFINKTNKNIIYPNNMPDIQVGEKVFRNIDVQFLKEIENSKTYRKIGVNIIWGNGKITAIDNDNNTVTIPVKENEPAQNKDKNTENFINSFNKLGNSDFEINDIKFENDLPFIPVSKMNEYRRIMVDNLMNERIKNYKKPIMNELHYSDYYKDSDCYKANVSNYKSKEFYNKCNCQITESAFEIKEPERQIELMRTKHCIKFALNKCKSKDKLYLIDEKGTKYPLLFDCKNCEMVILSK